MKQNAEMEKKKSSGGYAQCCRFSLPQHSSILGSLIKRNKIKAWILEILRIKQSVVLFVWSEFSITCRVAGLSTPANFSDAWREEAETIELRMKLLFSSCKLACEG